MINNSRIKYDYIKRIISVFVIYSMLSGIVAYAATVEIDSDYSKEYQEWLELPESEKEQVVEPIKYDIDTVEPQTIAEHIKNSYKATNLDSSFNLATLYGLPVKNQMSTNSCWAFSTLTCLESNLKMHTNKSYDFSERHLEYATSQYFTDGTNENGYKRKPGDGGNPLMAYAYLTNGQGAVNESDLPFENNDNLISISSIENKTVQTKVNDYRIFDTINKGSDSKSKIDANIIAIKEHVQNYGAVTAYTSDDLLKDNSEYFNSATNAVFCGSRDGKINHQVTIVGWNDNYSRTNFNSNNMPSANGAWIVQNSWGTNKGDGGYYYFSYEDAYIDYNATGVVSAVNKKDYDNIYQHDWYGSITKVTMGTSNVLYEAAVFEKSDSSTEQINEISFFTWDKQKCKIYINPYGTSKKSSDLTLVKNVTEELEVGYHTIKLDTPIKTNNNFVVVVAFENTDGKASVAIEAKTADAERYDNVKIATGEGFISNTLGSNWKDLASQVNGSPAIKAFTTYVKADKTLLGDVNQDGRVDANDKLFLTKYMAYQDAIVAKLHSDWNFNDEQKNLCDINKDGRVDANDKLRIAQHIAASMSETVAKEHDDWIIK